MEKKKNSKKPVLPRTNKLSEADLKEIAGGMRPNEPVCSWSHNPYISC
ncbi:MAG: hypothetical protein K8W52_08280 [Deltaproteobacteria bacterium]|nr:hypothetical protein [Deltaproteobacteria bacterium]